MTSTLPRERLADPVRADTYEEAVTIKHDIESRILVRGAKVKIVRRPLDRHRDSHFDVIVYGPRRQVEIDPEAARIKRRLQLMDERVYGSP